MTGTPIVNRPVELYPLLRYLDPHGWPSYDEFGMRYCGGGGKAIIQAYGASRGDWNAWCWRNNVPPSRVVPLSAWRQFRQEVGSRGMRVKEMAEYSGATNLEELRDRLYSTIMLRRLKRDVLPDLPPKIRQVVELSPSGAVSRRIAEEARLARAAGVDAETLSEAGFRASVSALRGPAAEAWEEMAVVRHELALAKLPYVVDHLRDALEGGKVVCFAHHRALVAGLAEAFPGSVQVVGGMRPEEKQAAVDAFQTDDAVRLFIGSTAAAEGLTLTAASHVVLAETFWVPGLVSQMEDRCHRIGQRDSVLCQWLVFADSLDAHIAQTVIRKQGVIEKTIG
jgi:SWI/SNF-related matrix-associated actin-dependent regulator 1 of chromatin subfamily A